MEKLSQTIQIEGIDKSITEKRNELFWSQIKNGWKQGVSVSNPESINLWGQEIKVCIVLCPLYSPGGLSESTLMPNPASIEGSRVANKIKAYMTVLDIINEQTSALGEGMSLKVVFANKGVLFNGKPESQDEGLLKHHQDIYIDTFYTYARNKGIGMEFTNYDNWKVSFPTFVDPNEPIPQNLSHLSMIGGLNEYLGSSILEDKKNKKVVEGILEMKGLPYSGAFWLIASYLVFDGMISNMVSPNGLYIAAERFPGLFGISKLTESLKELTRIQLNA